MKHLLSLFLFSGLASITLAGEPHLKVSATFEPAEAKPGQVVTLKIKAEMDPEWHTYPTVQQDKAAKDQVNKVLFDPNGPLVFVDKMIEPANPTIKEEPDLGIKAMHYYPGGGVWEKKVVISPNAPAGKLTTKFTFTVLTCDKNNCLPPKKVPLEVSLNVSGAPVPVDPKYKEDVAKALKK